MARRGSNSFRRNDGLRALRIAKDGGINATVLEIVTKDGTIFRVYDHKLEPSTAPTTEIDEGWAKQIAKLDAKTKERK